MTQQNIIRGQLTMFVFTNFQQSHIIKYASRKFERKYRHFKFQVQTMSIFLPKLSTKSAIDDVIKTTEDIVLVLRFGRETDTSCMQLDEIVKLNASYSKLILAELDLERLDQ